MYARGLDSQLTIFFFATGSLLLLANKTNARRFCYFSTDPSTYTHITSIVVYRKTRERDKTMMMMMSLRLQLVLTLALLSIVAVVSTSSNNFDDSSSNDYGDSRNLAAGGGGGSSNSGDEDHLHDPLFNGAVEGWRLALTSLLCWMVTSCAVAAGIGGGGLLVPLYALVLGVGTKLAIPISTATIFGVAIGNVAFIATKRHPNANRPLIEYATVVLMQPGELMGVVVGVLLNRLFPELLIVILLVLVLGFTALKTLKKGIARWKSETKLQLEAAEQQQEQAVLVEDDGVVDPSETRKEAPARESTMDVENSESSDADAPEPPQEAAAAAAAAEQAQDDNENNESSSDELAQIYKEESIQFPPLVYIALFVMTSFLIIYSLLLNGVIVQDFDNCSPAAYWPAYWSPVLVFGAMVWYFSRRNIARYLQKIDLGFVFADGDIHWSTKTVSLLGPAAVGAGVAAGLLGIGGGMVLGPLFVALNFEVSTILCVVCMCAWFDFLLHTNKSCILTHPLLLLFLFPLLL